ncbi:Response regulatory domain-containing protein [Bordetella sputigena]|uniref:excisionase family DNA-binding protein n=1 Tax=Bordetella sputigena TaxID=1416810 RepID=UPI0039EE111C
MHAPEDEFITTKKAAELIGVSVRTVQLWVEAGVLRAWKTEGGHRRVARASVDDLLQSRVAKEERALVGPAQGPLRVVVVEDDPHLQTVYELALTCLSFPLDLRIAGDGFSGLVRIGKFRPHVIVADLNLPGLDGFRMIRALREAPESRDAEVIVISALTSADIADRGGLPADVKVLSKPVPISSLEKLMAEAYQRLLSQPAPKA